jgi:hypothetical protein
MQTNFFYTKIWQVSDIVKQLKTQLLLDRQKLLLNGNTLKILPEFTIQ